MIRSATSDITKRHRPPRSCRDGRGTCSEREAVRRHPGRWPAGDTRRRRTSQAMRAGDQHGDVIDAGEGHPSEIPPILQTSFHSSAVTGCTDSREFLTSTMSLSFGSALIACERHRLRQRLDRLDVDHHPGLALLGGRIGIVLADDLDDADDLPCRRRSDRRRRGRPSSSSSG